MASLGTFIAPDDPAWRRCAGQCQAPDTRHLQDGPDHRCPRIATMAYARRADGRTRRAYVCGEHFADAVAAYGPETKAPAPQPPPWCSPFPFPQPAHQEA